MLPNQKYFTIETSYIVRNLCSHLSYIAIYYIVDSKILKIHSKIFSIERILHGGLKMSILSSRG